MEGGNDAADPTCAAETDGRRIKDGTDEFEVGPAPPAPPRLEGGRLPRTEGGRLPAATEVRGMADAAFARVWTPIRLRVAGAAPASCFGSGTIEFREACSLLRVSASAAVACIARFVLTGRAMREPPPAAGTPLVGAPATISGQCPAAALLHESERGCTPCTAATADAILGRMNADEGGCWLIAGKVGTTGTARTGAELGCGNRVKALEYIRPSASRRSGGRRVTRCESAFGTSPPCLSLSCTGHVRAQSRREGLSDRGQQKPPTRLQLSARQYALDHCSFMYALRQLARRVSCPETAGEGLRGARSRLLRSLDRVWSRAPFARSR